MSEQLLLLRHHPDVERWREPVTEYGRLLAAWPETDVDRPLPVTGTDARGGATRPAARPGSNV